MNRHLCMYVCMYVCMYIYIYIYIYVSMCVMYVSMCVMYVCMYVHSCQQKSIGLKFSNVLSSSVNIDTRYD